MPIRADLRHLYRGPEYLARRESILLRANNCCERCYVPNRVTVVRQFGWWTPLTIEAWLYHEGGAFDGVDAKRLALPWRHAGVQGEHVACFGGVCTRIVPIVLTIAHLDHDPTNNADTNLAALCQWCHLHHDRQQHGHNRRVTRAEARGQEFLFAEAAARI
jgi:hypothetical protein